MRPLYILLLLPLLLVVGGDGKPNVARGDTIVVAPVCIVGQPVTPLAKDSGGSMKILRSPMVEDSLTVVHYLQQFGQVPADYGDQLLTAIDNGSVAAYLGPGFTRWYFQARVALPPTLPRVNYAGVCKGNVPIVRDNNVPGWVWLQVPHGDRVYVPSGLLVSGMVCARVVGNVQTVHTPEQTEGSFAGVPQVICASAQHLTELTQRRGLTGAYYYFVVPAGSKGGGS